MPEEDKFTRIKQHLDSAETTYKLEDIHGRLVRCPPAEYAYPAPTNEKEFKELLKRLSARPRWVCGLVAAELMIPFTESAREIANTAFDLSWLHYFGKLRMQQLNQRRRELFGSFDLDQRPEQLLEHGLASELIIIHEETPLPDHAWFAMMALKQATHMTGKQYIYIERLMHCAAAAPTLHAKRDHKDFYSIHEGRRYDETLRDLDELETQRFYAHWWDNCLRFIDFNRRGDATILEDELHKPVTPFVIGD